MKYTSHLFINLLLYALSLTLARSEETSIREYQAYLWVKLNDEELRLPLLTGLDTRFEFPMKDIHQASLMMVEAEDCILWSDRDFSLTLIDDFDEAVGFPNANRLICYNWREIDLIVIVEDMSGNLEYHELRSLGSFDYKGSLKRPLHVRRAVPVGRNIQCQFRSRRTFSDLFTQASALSEPFRGAIEIICDVIEY